MHEDYILYYEDGEVIFEEDSVGQEFYIIESGKVEELNVNGQMVDTSPDGKKVVYSRFAGFEKSFWLAENFLPKEK